MLNIWMSNNIGEWTNEYKQPRKASVMLCGSLALEAVVVVVVVADDDCSVVPVDDHLLFFALFTVNDTFSLGLSLT